MLLRIGAFELEVQAGTLAPWRWTLFLKLPRFGELWAGGGLPFSLDLHSGRHYGSRIL